MDKSHVCVLAALAIFQIWRLVSKRMKRTAANVDLVEGKSTSDDNPVRVEAGEGVGGKNRSSSGASSSKKKSKKPAVAVETRRLTPEDDTKWPTDLPSGSTECNLSWIRLVRDAMHQGPFELCWAVALTRYLEALLAKQGIVVQLSAQHLVNSIKKKDNGTGKLMNYDEVRKFLIEEGLVLETACPYTEMVNESCSKVCQRSAEPRRKISNLIHSDCVDEKKLIELLQTGPIMGVLKSYVSFTEYKSGIYEGPKNRKDAAVGPPHAVLILGYGSTWEGKHFWIVQNSWGDKGIGFISRVCGRNGIKSSILKI